jgi:Serine phosphatase RsbU, regulator of sigma subunit
LEFAAHYKAAQKIGGDLYDVFQIDEDRIGVAIADVSGKGISASILMAICQTHLRHMAQHSTSPSEVLSAINAEMQKSMRQDMFITIIYAIIDLKKNCLILSRAGHEMPLYFHTEGESPSVCQVRSTGMALGMVPPEIFDCTIQDTQICFEEGDALLLYTDGVTESTNGAGEEYSGARLESLFKSCGHESAQDIQQNIIQSVNRFSGNGSQGDDLTLITIKRRA